MAVIGNQVIYTAPSDVEQTRPVVIRCTAVVRGQGILAREGVLSAEARETFDVVSIINDVIAICPGAEQEFTATVAGDRTVQSYEWFPGEEGAIKGSNTEQTVTYVAPTDFDFCVFGSVRVKITFDDGEVLEDTERFIIPPSLLSINSWNELDIIPDNKPIGLYAPLIGIEEIEQTPEDEVQYTWTSSSGSFSGSGERVKFTHPTVSEDTLVTITCMVTTSKYECGMSQIDYLVVHAVDTPPFGKFPQVPPIEKGPAFDFPPIPPLPPVVPFTEPPIPPIEPFPGDPALPPVRPFAGVPPLPPVEPLPVDLVPFKLPSGLCFDLAETLVVGQTYPVTVEYSDDGDWDVATGPFLSASAVGSFDGLQFTAPDTPERAVQLHCVFFFEGKAINVEIDEGYIEATLTRDVVAGPSAIESPNTDLRAHKVVNGQVQSNQFNPNTDTLDQCESLYLEVMPEDGNYDEVDNEWKEIPSAIAPTIEITSVRQVSVDMNVVFTAVPIGGTYDNITYAWDIIPPSGAGLIGSGSGPSRTYIPPRSVSSPVTVTITCVATVTGNGNNAQAGTSDVAFIAQETFQVIR